ncbi:hypothetical protein A5871_001315, partial [Enterococcus sp. 2F9_DIV0599]
TFYRLKIEMRLCAEKYIRSIYFHGNQLLPVTFLS